MKTLLSRLLRLLRLSCRLFRSAALRLGGISKLKVMQGFSLISVRPQRSSMLRVLAGLGATMVFRGCRHRRLHILGRLKSLKVGPALVQLHPRRSGAPIRSNCHVCCSRFRHRFKTCRHGPSRLRRLLRLRESPRARLLLRFCPLPRTSSVIWWRPSRAPYCVQVLRPTSRSSAQRSHSFRRLYVPPLSLGRSSSSRRRICRTSRPRLSRRRHQPWGYSERGCGSCPRRLRRAPRTRVHGAPGQSLSWAMGSISMPHVSSRTAWFGLHYLLRISLWEFCRSFLWLCTCGSVSTPRRRRLRPWWCPWRRRWSLCGVGSWISQRIWTSSMTLMPWQRVRRTTSTCNWLTGTLCDLSPPIVSTSFRRGCATG